MGWMNWMNVTMGEVHMGGVWAFPTRGLVIWKEKNCALTVALSSCGILTNVSNLPKLCLKICKMGTLGGSND